MSKQSSIDSQDKNPSANARVEHILGLPMSDLAGVTVDEILNNKPALTMVMHYYKQLSDENSSLKNDLNTAGTYLSSYDKKTSDANVGAGMQFLATVCIGFAINLLTGNDDKLPGAILLGVGIVLQVVGLYYSSLRKS